MFLSPKYLILYVGAGLATGYISKGDKTVALIGVILAAMAGYSFGINYAIVSAIEFGAGLGIAAIISRSKPTE